MVNCFLLMVSALGGVPPVSSQLGKQLCRHSSADDSGLSLGPPSRKPLKLGPELCLRPLFFCARRSSSTRGMMVPMPCPTLPPIQPDASNTIMASSLHGEGWAPLPPSTSHATVTASEIAARQTERKSRTMLCAPWDCPTDAQSAPALNAAVLGRPSGSR